MAGALATAWDGDAELHSAATATGAAGPDAAAQKLIQTATGEKNRAEKILEDANVKLGTVLSDIFGVSGQLMLEALLRGEADVKKIAEFAQAQARVKIPQIVRRWSNIK